MSSLHCPSLDEGSTSFTDCFDIIDAYAVLCANTASDMFLKVYRTPINHTHLIIFINPNSTVLTQLQGLATPIYGV